MAGANWCGSIVPDREARHARFRTDELQRKADRPAFKETIRLPAGEVYVSPVELNQENGAIETPHVPVLRVATPLYAPDGRPFGIVIINVDMRPAFARIRTAANGGRQGYVVNDQGDYLLHPDPGREFGFEFARPARIQDDFPDFAEILAAGAAAPRVVEDRTGHRFGVGIVSLRLAEGPRIAVIEALPYAELMAATIAVRDSSLIAGLAAAFCAFLLRNPRRPLADPAAGADDQGGRRIFPRRDRRAAGRRRPRDRRAGDGLRRHGRRVPRQDHSAA